jgi:hypothetical protein
MDRVLQSKFFNVLPYSLVLLGVSLIVLAAFNSLLLANPAENQPVAAPA